MIVGGTCRRSASRPRSPAGGVSTSSRFSSPSSPAAAAIEYPMYEMRDEANPESWSDGGKVVVSRLNDAAGTGVVTVRTTTTVAGTAVKPENTVVTFSSRKMRRRARRLPVEARKVTWKLDEPPLSNVSEVIALTVRRPTMFMAALSQYRLSIESVRPLTVAVAPVIVTVPKFARGRTPESDEGAYTIHSADDRSARGMDLATPNDLPLV